MCFGTHLCLYPSDRVCPFVNSIHSQVPSGFYTATAEPISLPANAASMRMSWYNDLRYISLLSIRFCRSEGNRTSGGKHICPCSSYYPFAFILLIGCKDSHLNAISNLPVEISADFLLDIKYLQCHFSNFCWTVVITFNLLYPIAFYTMIVLSYIQLLSQPNHQPLPDKRNP